MISRRTSWRLARRSDPEASKTHELPWRFYQGDPSLTWEQFVLHDGPLVKDGRIQVPDKPGLGVEPNPDYVRAHLAPGEACGARRFRVKLALVLAPRVFLVPSPRTGGGGGFAHISLVFREMWDD